MANTVIALKKSAMTGATPGSLANGELAINYADGVIYYRAANGTIASISSGTPSFGTIVANGTALIADQVNDYLTINQGDNIIITGDAINDKLTINADLTAANSWANTKLSNTDNVVFNGSLQIANTLYAKDLVISNTMIANISGNINTLYIQNDITHVNSIFFATNAITSANGLVVAGQLTWNPDDLTLDLGTGSSIQQIGQEQYVKILNQSGETIYNSNAVSYYGTVGNSGRLLGRRAIANNSYDSKQILGIATQDIVNGAEGFVTTFGKVRKINTSMFSEGDILYVSPSIPGALQNTKPTAPNNKVQIGTVITKSATVGMIFTAVQRGSSLADDELVFFNGSIAEGDLIRYVGANGRFQNFNENSIGPATNAVAAFAKANAANVLAYNTGIGANAWANAVGTAGNNYTNAVGVAGNNYSVSVGASSNAWANAVGTAGNNYTNSVGTAGNNYTVSVGAASNTWANNVGTAGNNYTNSVGVAGNNYTNSVGTAGNNYTNSVGLAANNYAAATYYAKSGGTISGDVTITGNLTISGNTTYANTQTLLIGDNILVLNADLPAAVAPTENAGLDVNRGSSANASLWWNETTDRWTFSNGTVFYNIASNTDIEAGNAYVTAIGTAGNNYTNSVGVAGNNYTNSVGTAGNNYMLSVATSANIYAGQMVNAANAWANTKGGGASVNVGSSSPTGNTQGSLWYNTDYGRLLIWYTDADSSQWVDTGAGGNQPIIFDEFAYGNTNTDYFLTGASNAYGTFSTAYISTGKLKFNPNTGIINVSGGLVTSGNINATGTITATVFNSLSDINKKTNVQIIDHAIDKVSQLDGVTFNWKDNGQPSAGLIAQQLKEVMPELVGEDMTVNYSGVIGLLIECIKELNTRIPK